MAEDSSGDVGRSRGPWPSPAMVVALLALFVALGGSAWAVSKVGTNQLKANAVTTPKIKPGAVNGSRLASRAVTEAKIADGAVTGPKIGPGAVGPANLAPNSVGTEAMADGAIGPNEIQGGAVGTPALIDGSVTSAKLATGAVGGSNIAIETINGTPVSIPGGTSEVALATCPQGKKAVSAGWQSGSGLVDVYQQYVTGNTALIYAVNSGPPGQSIQVTAQVVCI